MKKIISYILYILLALSISACGTGKFLGFDKKKVPLEGKRISVLKDLDSKKKDDFSLSKIQLTDPVASEEWRQSYNSPSHISVNFLSTSKFIGFDKVTSGKRGGGEQYILSQPVVSKNIIFFLDALSNLYAYDLNKKKNIWKKKLIVRKDKGHNFGGGIAADDEFLFVSSPSAEVFCIDLYTGKTIWKRDTLTPVRAIPTLLKNKLIILTLDNRTLLFNKTDGSLVWEHQGIQNSTSIIGQPKVAADGNLVLTPYSNGDIFALNLTNGSELWRQSTVSIEQSETSNTFSDIDANPVILKNLIIVASTNGKIFAFNKKNGGLIWEQYLNTSQTPLVNGNSIYVIHNNRELVNLDLTNGKIRWIAELEKYFKNENDNIWFSPILVNSKLIIVGGYKNMLIINPLNGELDSKYSLPGTPASSPIIVKQEIFLMFKNASIFSIK